MSRRCRNYCDDSDSDVDLPRSGRASRSAASRKGSGEFGMKSRKEQSRPWSQEESEWLIQVVSKTSTNLDNINWQDVAKQVPGRTGKQCREKWKNDLRPNICKEPWSLKEEYVLAVAHSLHGNRWSEVAKYLPTRPENTIKNRWYATNRAKAEVKIRTFLWLYSDLVDRQSYPAGPEAIEKARELYRQLPDVVPLEEFEVPVDFYIAKTGEGCPASLDTRPEIKIIGRGKAKPHVPGATTVGGGGGGGGSAAPAAVLSAVRGGAAAAGASRAARGSATATSAAVAASAATAAAAAVAAAGIRGGKGRAGDSGGGVHSEGDANCYVKVGGMAGELQATGAVKVTPRKRKIPGLLEADGLLQASSSIPKMVKKELLAVTAATGPEVLSHAAAANGGDDGVAPVNTRARGAADDPRAPPLAGNHMTAAQGALMVASPAATAAAVAAVTVTTGGVGRGGSTGGGGPGSHPSHHHHHHHHYHHPHPHPHQAPPGALAPALDPEFLWQSAVEPFNNPNHHSNGNTMTAQKGHRMSVTRLAAGRGAVAAGGQMPPHHHPVGDAGPMYGNLGGGGGAAAAPPGVPAAPGGDPDSLHSIFSSSARLVGSEGGASSAADLGGLFQFGPNGLNGLLEDAEAGGAGGGNDGDPDLLGLTDGLDLASLTALIGPNDGEATSDCAHEAMAGLAADVLSKMPDPTTPRNMSQQQQHGSHNPQHPEQHLDLQQQQQQQMPPCQHAHNHLSQTVTTSQSQSHPQPPHSQPDSGNPHAHTHPQHRQQQQMLYAHQQQQQQTVMRHASSLGSAQQQRPLQHPHQQQQAGPHSHPHSLSQGSYPLPQQHPQQIQQQQQQVIIQPHEGACGAAQQQQQSQQQQQMQSFASRGGITPSMAPASHLSPQQQQQQQKLSSQGPADASNPQLQQQQQQQTPGGSHDVTAGSPPYIPYQRVRPSVGTMPGTPSRPPGATPIVAGPGHHPLTQHPMYGSASYMPHPHSGATAPTTPGASMMSGSGCGGRPMMPGGPSPSPVKFGMVSPYAVSGPPPPGAPYTVSGPPPPYMMPMNVRPGYYKVPGGRMPAAMPRGMMPYAPSPYGMSAYPPPHGMAPAGYMDHSQPPPPGMGMGATGGGSDGSGVHHPQHPSQQVGPLEPCTPGAANSSPAGLVPPPHGGGGGRISQGSGGPGGVLEAMNGGMGTLGVGRPFAELATSVAAPAAGTTTGAM